MPFNRDNLRLERLHIQLGYHAAFQYWNAKALLAERWAHGPHFGAYVEGPGDQLVLTPAADENQGAPPAPIQAVVGIRASALIAERVTEPARTRQLAHDWLSDVYTALSPRRTVQVRAQLFGLYPIRDPGRATEKLRNRFYVPDQLEHVIPERFRGNYHCAIDVFVPEGDAGFSIVVGVVGPPHKGTFFSYPERERDEAWWMGINLNFAETSEDGIDRAVHRVDELTRRLQDDLDRVARTVLPDIVR